MILLLPPVPPTLSSDAREANTAYAFDDAALVSYALS